MSASWLRSEPASARTVLVLPNPGIESSDDFGDVAGSTHHQSPRSGATKRRYHGRRSRRDCLRAKSSSRRRRAPGREESTTVLAAERSDLRFHSGGYRQNSLTWGYGRSDVVRSRSGGAGFPVAGFGGGSSVIVLRSVLRRFRV